MREEFRPAIEALQRDLADLEKKAADTRASINRLCEIAGAPLMYADAGTASQPTITSIRADSFYGKVIVTAAREFLEMRKAADLGPASPRDIFVALKTGGFAFDTANDSNAITGIRNTLRKTSQIFHRLPNGEYGLLKWYPNAKAQRQDEDNDKPSAGTSRGGKRKRGRPSKGRGKKERQAKKRAAPNVIDLAAKESGAADETDAADTIKASAA